MCGLYGWHLDPEVTTGERVALALTLAAEMNERGEESWGAWTADQSFVHKMTGSVMTGAFAMRLAAFDSLAVHTRYATHGDVTQDNAHPFRALHVVGAHNGCIWNAYDLDAKYAGRRDYEVDSMHLIAHIAQGYDLSEMQGYGAVVWSDARVTDAFYMGRFCDGELAIARVFDSVTGEARGMVWASTKRALEAACMTAGLGWSMLRVKEGRVYRVSRDGMLKTTMRLTIRKRPPVRTPGVADMSKSAADSARTFVDAASGPRDANEAALEWLRRNDALDKDMMEAGSGTARYAARYDRRTLRDGFRTMHASDESYCDGCDAPLRMACEVREGFCLACIDAASDSDMLPGVKSYAG